jgi:hypothetical protein
VEIQEEVYELYVLKEQQIRERTRTYDMNTLWGEQNFLEW